MSKKSLILWLSAIFMYAWILAASAQVNVSISGPEQAAQGELLTASVDVSGVSNLDTAFILLTYDASVLQATQIMPGTLTASANPVTNTQTPGQVRILINLPDVDGVSGSGSIAQIEFKAIGAEGSFSELGLSEVSLGNIAAESISAQPAPPLRIAIGSDALVDIKLLAPGTAAEGDLVTITLESGKVRDLDAVFAVFEYDQTVLQYVDARKGALTKDGTPTINANTPGKVRIVMNLPGVDGVSGSGSLIELDFTVVGEPGSSSSLSLSEVTLGDVNALEIPIKQPLSAGLEVITVPAQLRPQGKHFVTWGKVKQNWLYTIYK